MGAALISADAARGITEKLEATDFYRPTHQQVFTLISDLVHEGREVDALTVGDRFDDRLYLLDLTAACTTSSRWSEHADIVRRDARLRSLITTLTEYTAEAYTAGDESVIGEAAGALLRMTDKGGSGSHTLHSLIDKRIEDYRNPTPYFMAIGSKVKLHFGDLTILAGTPGSGKTAFALANADMWGKRYPVAFYTYEMSADELADRFISRATGSPVDVTYDGISEDEAKVYQTFTYEIARRNVSIKEASGMSERQLEASLKSFAFAGGKIAVIDYIQIAYDQTRAGENADITRFSKMLRRIAKSTGVAIFALSQFSRDGNTEDDKVLSFPKMKHLRGSGSLEQDAANICLMFSYPHKDTKLGGEARSALKSTLAADLYDDRDLIRAHWAKVRHGKREVSFLMFDGNKMDFEEAYER